MSSWLLSYPDGNTRRSPDRADAWEYAVVDSDSRETPSHDGTDYDACFALALTDENKQFLLDSAHTRIDLVLRERTIGFFDAPPPGILHERFGAFVTLRLYGSLRGCIGKLLSSDPLYITVADMAEAAAFHDSRFSPLTMGEFPAIEIEISVMSPITRCDDPSQVNIGRHGLIMRRGGQQGLLLPQVAVEWEWDRETFLAQACRKAGLPLDAWHDPDTEIYWFEALVFG